MATSDIKITPGTGSNVATYSVTEDAETKQIGRATLNSSAGTEIGTSSNPVEVNLRSSTVGVATETTLGGVLTTSDFDSKAGSLTETAPATDTASSGLNGRLQRVAQRLTSLIALLPSALGAGGGLKVDGSGTALPVSGTVTTNAGTNLNTSALALETGGNLATAVASLSVLDDWDDGSDRARTVGAAAHGASVAGNPNLMGLEARKTLPSAVGDGTVVRNMGDQYGMTVIVAWPTSHATSNGTPITATSTSVVSAPSAGNHIRVLRFHISNGGSTATWVALRDGASGNQYYRSYLPQGGLVSLNLNAAGPLDLTTATRLDIVLSAAGSVEYTVDYLVAAD